MKKLSYLLGLFLVAGMLFSSCSKDEDEEPVDLTPTINFKGGTDYVSSDITIFVGDTIKIGVIAQSNATSGKKLTNFKIVLTSNDIPETKVDSTIDISTFDADFLYSSVFPGETRLSAKITDKDGLSKEIAFVITAEANTTPLDGVQAIEWIRDHGEEGTGLDMFGLQWKTNAKDNYAKIKKNEDDPADLFVKLTADEWASITTKDGLAIAVEAATEIDSYEDVNLTFPSDDYNDVLATKYNGEYFIIHIQQLTAVPDGVEWIFTITGEYNK